MKKRRIIRKEVQLDLLDLKIPKPRGGFREGAGRPAKRGKTVVKRIPEKYAPAINALIQHLDDQREVSNKQTAINLRDLDDQLVQLDIVTKKVSSS